MCDYQGIAFGAHYDDAMCHEGYLWDMDSCDEPGGALHHGGDIPCPKCNLAEHGRYLSDDVFVSGNARQRRRATRVYQSNLRSRIVAALRAA